VEEERDGGSFFFLTKEELLYLSFSESVSPNQSL
jgi:hypothetical protein